jgi:hypothetical protein
LGVEKEWKVRQLLRAWLSLCVRSPGPAIGQGWKELEEQKAFRRLAGLEVTSRLYDAAFVGAASMVADRARSRIARALAYRGDQRWHTQHTQPTVEAWGASSASEY